MGSSLKISVPPYPAEIEGKDATEKSYGRAEGLRINGSYGKDFIPIDVMKGKNTELQGAGCSCIIGECLGKGKHRP